MKKSAFLILCCSILLCMGCIGCSYEPEVATTLGLITEDEKLLETLKPKLPAISESRPNDLDIQIGIVYLYRKYGAPFETAKQYENYKEMVQAQYDKVLRIDPNSKPIWAMKAKQNFWDISNQLSHRYMELETIKRIMRNTNQKEFVVTQRHGLLFDWLREGNEEKINIVNFNAVREKLRNKFNEVLPLGLLEIDKAESVDKCNALYSYLRANLLLDAGKGNEAVKEIEQALTKEYASTYQDEMAKAAAKVLKEAGLKQSKIDWITGIRTSTLGHLGSEIWSEGLSKMAEQYERDGDYDEAERIYKMAVLTDWQLTVEAVFPWVKGIDNKAFGKLVQVREKRLKELILQGVDQRGEVETMVSTGGYLKNNTWVQRLFELAESYQKQDQYDKAERTYKQIILWAWYVEKQQKVLTMLDCIAFEKLVQLRAERFKKFIEESKRTSN